MSDPQSYDFQWNDVSDQLGLDVPIFDALPDEFVGDDLGVESGAVNETGGEAIVPSIDEAVLDLEATAEAWQEVEAEAIEDGDYEMARDAAFEAMSAQQNADMLSGTDSFESSMEDSNTSESMAADYESLNDAVWLESTAESFAQDSIDYAEQGSFDAATSAMETAVNHQEFADLEAESVLTDSLGGDVGVPVDTVDVSFDVGFGTTGDTSFDTSFDMDTDSTLDGGYTDFGT